MNQWSSIKYLYMIFEQETEGTQEKKGVEKTFHKVCPPYPTFCSPNLSNKLINTSEDMF